MPLHPARIVFALLCAALIALAAGCGQATPTGDNNAAGSSNPDAALTGPLTIYCGRSESLVGPLIERFKEQAGIEVNVTYMKTPELATTLATEGELSPADVFFAQDPGHLGALARQGLLAELPANLLTQVDSRFRDPAGRWIGTTGRARVLVYNPDTIAEADLPKTLQEMADPQFTNIGWAPTNGSFQSHVSALRHIWGEDETRAWLAAVRDNGATVYPKNSPQVMAASNGEIAFGWVNHYYLHKLSQQGDLNARNHSFATAGDAGNVLMVAGAGITASSEHRAAAEAFVAFLVAEETQEWFAQETFEYPTRIGVPTHPDVRPLDELNLANVDQTAMSDIGPTTQMLRDLGLIG